MAESNSPESLQELLAGYVLGNLSPEEAEELQTQLAEHPDLMEEVAQLQEVLAVLPYGLPEAKPSAELRTTILKATTATPLETAQPPRTRRRFGRSLPLVAGSIAAVAAIAIGLDNLQLRQQLRTAQSTLTQQQTQLAQQDAKLASQKDLIAMLQHSETHITPLKGMAQLTRASGTAVVTDNQPEAILILKNLPPLTQEKSYTLWEITNGKKIACGTFRPNDQGQVFVKLPVINPQQPTFAVTIEDSPNPAQPQGPMVMTSKI